MPEKQGQQGPELSAALDARERPVGLEPGFPKPQKRPFAQTAPSAVAEADQDSEHAIPINPPAHPDGS